MLKVWWAVAFAGALGMTSEAAAATYIATYTGHVRYVGDAFQRFDWLANGDGYTATFTIDDQTPGVILTASPISSYLGGISSQISPSSLHIEIGSHDLDFPAEPADYSRGEAYMEYDPVKDTNKRFDFIRLGNSDVSATTDHESSVDAAFDVSGPAFVNSRDYRQSFYHATDATDDGFGELVIIDSYQDLATRDLQEEATYIYFTVDSVKVDGLASPPDLPPEPIPEPQTWSLLVAGVALAGAMLRGRRARPAIP